MSVPFSPAHPAAEFRIKSTVRIISRTATAAGAGVYQMMAHEKVVVARAAWEDLAKRLEGKQKKEIAQ